MSVTQNYKHVPAGINSCDCFRLFCVTASGGTMRDDMRRTLKYRMYECDRNKHLHRSINASAQIWNHALALQKRFYRMFGKYIGKAKLQKHIATLRNRNEYWQLVGSQAMQDIVERLDKAYQRFFKWAKTRKGIKCSPPKFKAFRKYKSFTLKQTGWKLLGGNKLRIQGRNYKFVKSREIIGCIKTVTVKRDHLNRLWVCLSVVEEFEPKSVSLGKSCGADFGLKTFLSIDDESTVESPLFFKRNMRRIAACNRDLASKKKGSSNRKKAKHRLAKAHEKAANQRRDWHFKTAHALFDRFDTVFLEGLCLKGMQARWGRKVSDLGFADFVSIADHVAEKRGKQIIKIDRWAPTSKTCHNCGEIKDSLSLWDRVFDCDECHLVIDRDLNAAINIHRLGRESYRLGTVSRESDSCCSA